MLGIATAVIFDLDGIAASDLDELAGSKTETLGRALDELPTISAVMVGDRVFDVVAARAHAIPCIGVTWGIGSPAELHDADRLIDTPQELPEAAAVLLAD